MPVRPPDAPKLYHLAHVDRLPSIVADGRLWSDAEAARRGVGGTTIGMDKIKRRRLAQPLVSHAGLTVGACAPFYFCTRSVMLHAIHSGDDPDLAYRAGQAPVVHLELDLREVAAQAEAEGLRWAFTTANAGSGAFADYRDLARLDRIDWDIVLNPDWIYRRKDKTFEEAKAAKQAEFLVERAVPWALVRRIGVYSEAVREQALAALAGGGERPVVEVRRGWYH